MTWRINWNGRPVVYRCYSADGRLIYVGSTVELDKRMATHFRRIDGSFWARQFHKLHVTLCPTEDEARDLEQQVIRDECPRFNIRHQRPREEMTREQFEDYITAVKKHCRNSAHNLKVTVPYLVRAFHARFPQEAEA